MLVGRRRGVEMPLLPDQEAPEDRLMRSRRIGRRLVIFQLLFRRALPGARERAEPISHKFVLGTLGEVVLLPQRRFVVELARGEDAAEPLRESHAMIVVHPALRSSVPPRLCSGPNGQRRPYRVPGEGVGSKSQDRTQDRTRSPKPPLLHHLHRITMRSPRGSTRRDGPAWIRTRDQRIMSPDREATTSSSEAKKPR